MKITLLSYPDGTIIITKPHQTRDITDDIGEVQEITRVGTITYKNGGYNTEFLLDKLKSYDRQGFHSREEAIAYEQNILDTYLGKILVDFA